jgi:hypothetical protein
MQSTTHIPPITSPLLAISLQSPQKKKTTDETELATSKKRKVGAQLGFARKKRKVEGLMRSLKIRVYPNARQKALLKQWMGCARQVF